MKKPVIVVLLVALILVLAPSTLMAKISGDPLQQYKTPFLLTSGGQGAGSKMLRLLINQTKKLSYGENADFFLEDETPARYSYVDSGKYNALVVVISVTEM